MRIVYLAIYKNQNFPKAKKRLQIWQILNNLQNRPKIDSILPNQQNFAKTGHTLLDDISK